MKNYLKNLKNDKKEIFFLVAIAVLSLHLVMKLTGGFSFTFGYDVLAEISGYMIIVSSIICLFISQFKNNLNQLGLATFLVSLLNYTHIRSTGSYYFVKIGLIYLAIFLLIACVVKILKSSDNKKKK